MSGRRTRTIKITGMPSSFDLGDLRHLVNEAVGLADDTPVSLHVDKGYTQLDAGSSSLSVTIDETSA